MNIFGVLVRIIRNPCGVWRPSQQPAAAQLLISGPGHSGNTNTLASLFAVSVWRRCVSDVVRSVAADKVTISNDSSDSVYLLEWFLDN